MKTKNQIKYKDYSIIFRKIEKNNKEDACIQKNIVLEDTMLQNESILEFSKICQEINFSENEQMVLTTFS